MDLPNPANTTQAQAQRSQNQPVYDVNHGGHYGEYFVLRLSDMVLEGRAHGGSGSCASEDVQRFIG
jgi:hypothetical protein